MNLRQTIARWKTIPTHCEHKGVVYEMSKKLRTSVVGRIVRVQAETTVNTDRSFRG